MHSNYQQPVITELPKDHLTKREREEVILPCKASGTPTPKIAAWLKDDVPVSLNTGQYELLTNGGLKMRIVTRNMAGEYQCVASNDQGGVISEKRKFIVACMLTLFSS